MANVIKHKRGTSDPSPSDLEVGEIGIRTDVGKLFTKTDSGSVAEIAGGGSDIIINTLSSSSATGGGSATFNGSAYRFTLSQPPSVSAQQLLVSIAGVIQKPVAGNGQPSEGFSINGNDIILASAPATGTDFFILTFKSLGVSEPADNTVTNAKVASNAAIAGTKINPSFTSDITVTNTAPKISLVDSNANSDFEMKVNAGNFAINDSTNSENRFLINSGGQIGIGTANPNRLLHQHENSAGVNYHLFTNSNTGASGSDGLLVGITGVGQGIMWNYENQKLRFATNATERLTIAADGKVGIGATSPSDELTIRGSQFQTSQISIGDNGDRFRIGYVHSDGLASSTTASQIVSTSGSDLYIAPASNAASEIHFFSNASSGAPIERMRIDSSGRLLLGTTTEGHAAGDNLTVADSGNAGITIRSGSSNNGSLYFSDGTSGSDEYRGAVRYLHGDNALQAYTNGVERIRIDSSGRVGIGTTSPAAELHVESATPEIRIKSTNANVGQGTEIGRLAIHTNDPTTPTGAGEVFKITTYSAQGNGADYGTKLINRAGSNSGESVISLGQDAVGDIVFYTNTTGSGQEAMRINRRGFITKTRQAMFEARGNNTAFSAQSPLPYPSVAYNIGSCYDNTTYKFTAPVDGYYQVMAHVIPTDYTAGGNNVELYVMDNHGTRYFLDRKLKSSNYSSNNFSVGGTRIIYADYTDTLWLQFHAISGTPKVETASFFSIMLVA